MDEAAAKEDTGSRLRKGEASVRNYGEGLNRFQLGDHLPKHTSTQYFSLLYYAHFHKNRSKEEPYHSLKDRV